VQHRVSSGNLVLRCLRVLAILCAFGLGLARVDSVAAQADALSPATVNNEDEIVYIDAGGFISVFDPNSPEGLSPVVFRSPDGGWYDATVGDVNGDGDDEIIAIAENGLLKIYDPVVNTTNITPDNQSGGIYWEQLFEFVLPGAPLLIDTGDLDGNPATLEMVVVHLESGSTTRTRVQVYFQPFPAEGGRIWLPLTDVTMRELWSDISVGDLDGDGQAEIALVNEDLGTLSVLRREPNNVLTEFWTEESNSRPWQGAVIGNVEPNLPAAELVAVRRVAPPEAALVVRRYQAVNQFADVVLRSYLPAPRVTFLADINGDGEDEIFLLRDVPATDTRARLFISNLGTDAFNFEARLDSDNGYRYGASGDTDGDGRDEIAVIRNSAISLFTQPETNTISRTLSANTNRRTLVMGNLDALGRDQLIASTRALTFSVPAGAVSASQTVTLSNRTRPGAIPFAIRTAPATALLLMTASSSATTAQLTVQVDARTLLPASSVAATEDVFPILPAAGVFTPTYGTNLIVVSSNPLVANSPLTIPVIVDVTAGIALRPSHISVIKQQTVDADICSLPATVASVQVLGTAGSSFTANLQARSGAGGDWLGVAPVTATVPATLDITVAPNPGLAPGESAVATLVLDGVVNTTTPFTVERRLEIDIRCYSHLGFLPLVTQ
jgi:hypothetical protein